MRERRVRGRRRVSGRCGWQWVRCERCQRSGQCEQSGGGGQHIEQRVDEVGATESERVESGSAARDGSAWIVKAGRWSEEWRRGRGRRRRPW